MKMPLDWHKECLENTRKHLARMKEQARQLREAIERSERDIVLYDGQIIRAEAMGKDGFDSDKFGGKK